MSKRRQSIVLSRWFTVDRVLFGKNNPKDVLGEDAFQGYITAKAAFLSGLNEIYRKLHYDPKQNFKNLSEMKSFGILQADNAKSRAKKIIVTDSVASNIRSEIKNISLAEGVTSEQMQSYMIDKKIKAIAFDVVMLESVMASTGNKNSLKDFSGKVMLSAYKTFRDSLLKYAY